MSDYKVTQDDLAAFADLISYANSGGYVPNDRMLRVHPIDPETSLPQLPEGYFWRVFKQYGSAKVGLFAKRETSREVTTFMTLFTGKTKTVVDTAVRKIEDYHILESASDPVAGIFQAASMLLQYLPSHLATEINPVDYSAYYGDYPPKNVLTAGDDES